MWLVEHEDGTLTQHVEEPGGRMPAGTRHAQIPRELALHRERWDWERCCIVPRLDGVLADIDAEHAAAHGAQAIAVAHAVKLLEARLMLAGTAISGLVAAEAQAAGTDPLVLAQRVVTQAAADQTAELARTAAKRAARGIPSP